MKRHIMCLVICLVLCMILAACDDSVSDKNTSTNNNNPTESIPAKGASPTEINTLPHTPTDDSTITWAVHFSANITEEAQAEIRKLLKAKDIDIKIEFLPISYDCGREYESWLNKQKELNTTPDILSGSLWEHGTMDAAAFTAREFLSLNPYLESEEGRILRDAFADVEWEKYTVGGEVRVIPVRLTKEKEPLIYLYVNNRHKDTFERTFDGTYKSLKTFCRMVDDRNPVVTLDGMGQTLLLTIMGYNKGFVSFDPQNQAFVDLTRQKKTREVLQTVFSDYQDGLLVDAETVENIPENVLVYIHKGRLDPAEGFTEYVWTKDLFVTSAGVGYGVFASSPKKELALQVLSICYSDPQIASLLSWGYADGTEWIKRTEYLKSCKSSTLTGYLPNLSYKECEAVFKYDEDLDVLCKNMYMYSDGERTGINPDYEAYLDRFFSQPRDYGSLFDDINKQFAEWLENR